MRVLIYVARTMFLAPKGMYTARALAARLKVGMFHEYPRPVRPGSWVEQALWRVRVDAWNDQWDVVGVAIRSAQELPSVAEVMAEALSALRSRSKIHA
jgi:hypothetical protein